MKINVKKLHKDAILPTYGSEESAGMDLYAMYSEDDDEMWVEAGKTIRIHTGIAMEIPKGYVGLIFARSGLATKSGLAPANKVGVIDSDYRGEIIVAMHNHNFAKDDVIGNEPSTFSGKQIEKGERIAQMVIVPCLHAELTEVNELSDTARGEGGFGSTGSK